jgi:hypothetical protein
MILNGRRLEAVKDFTYRKNELRAIPQTSFK